MLTYIDISEREAAGSKEDERSEKCLTYRHNLLYFSTKIHPISYVIWGALAEKPGNYGILSWLGICDTNKDRPAEPTFNQISLGESVTYSVTYRDTETAINRIGQGSKKNWIGTRKSPKCLDFSSISGFSAEKPGFEPGRRSSHPTPLAGEPLRPLGYFSIKL